MNVFIKLSIHKFLSFEVNFLYFLYISIYL